MKNNTVTKKKLSDLKAKPYTLKLVHPEYGDTGATITIVSYNNNLFVRKQLEMNQSYANVNEADITLDTKINIMAELNASVVVDWDEDFFEKEFTTENVVELFKDNENSWIVAQVKEALEKSENFFPKI